MKKLNEIFEGNFVFDSKTLKENDLAVYIEILNMKEATGESEFDEYSFLVSFSLVAHTPDKSFDETYDKKGDRLDLIFDAARYMGGVPIDHKLQELDENKTMYKLKAKDALIKKDYPEFGTIAAQYGKGAEFEYPQFKTYDAALSYAKKMLIYVDDLDFDCILSQPINMMGETGENTIYTMRNGK